MTVFPLHKIYRSEDQLIIDNYKIIIMMYFLWRQLSNKKDSVKRKSLTWQLSAFRLNISLHFARSCRLRKLRFRRDFLPNPVLSFITLLPSRATAEVGFRRIRWQVATSSLPQVAPHPTPPPLPLRRAPNAHELTLLVNIEVYSATSLFKVASQKIYRFHNFDCHFQCDF